MQQDLDLFAMKLIRRAARKLVGQFGFTAVDRPELEQGLALEVFKRLRSSKTTPERPQAFVTTVVKRSAAQWLNADRLEASPAGNSPSTMIQGPDGGKVALRETVTADRRLAHRGVPFQDEQDRLDLALSIQELLPRLPVDLRKSVEALMEGAPFKQVAKEAGVPPATLRDRLRKIFTAAGISKDFQ